MFFLQSLFDLTENLLGDSINHFPLIELIFYSLDQALFYFIFWAIGRSLYLFIRKKKQLPIKIRREVILNLFVFYLILLIHLTVFREENSIGNVAVTLRSLDQINWTPFVHTFKLTQGVTLFDYYYNLYGNILWFIPMGFGAAYLTTKRHYFFKTLLLGSVVSFSIETMQFLFHTGVADIDDLIFNTIGTLVGLILFEACQWIFYKVKGIKKRKINSVNRS
ncbi:VanZ family protein [Carnobacterium sp. CS13]|uniref:VanZ family protein n=1 Tax=Carnobacterium sp. CS13 TaxID=2800128 RepID=UPI001913C694|nr:VanZ family protein [Carnobacterium sp. CS13]QQP69692.1 VanZ family protein [Carnobacterium sp. CS13]